MHLESWTWPTKGYVWASSHWWMWWSSWRWFHWTKRCIELAWPCSWGSWSDSNIIHLWTIKIFIYKRNREDLECVLVFSMFNTLLKFPVCSIIIIDLIPIHIIVNPTTASWASTNCGFLYTKLFMLPRLFFQQDTCLRINWPPPLTVHGISRGDMLLCWAGVDIWWRQCSLRRCLFFLILEWKSFQ